MEEMGSRVSETFFEDINEGRVEEEGTKVDRTLEEGDDLESEKEEGSEKSEEEEELDISNENEEDIHKPRCREEKKNKKNKGGRSGFCTLKFKHLVSNNAKNTSKKKKKMLVPCTGEVFEEREVENHGVSEEGDNTSNTISAGIEIGIEGRRKDRVLEESIRNEVEEAKLTIEVGRKVRVTFNPDPSSAINVLLGMERRTEEHAV